MTKQIFCAMGESGRGFDMEVIRISKLKKKIIEYDGS